jgi:hypothetical protein
MILAASQIIFSLWLQAKWKLRLLTSSAVDISNSCGLNSRFRWLANDHIVIILYRVPEFLFSRLNCVPHLLHPTGRRHTRLRGRGRGTQFRRLDRNSGTPCTYYSTKYFLNTAKWLRPSSIKWWNSCDILIFASRIILFWQLRRWLQNSKRTAKNYQLNC